MQMKKLVFSIFIFCVLSLYFVACNQPSQGGMSVYDVYYVNQDGTGVSSYSYETVNEDGIVVLQELIMQMETLPEKLEYRPPLTGNFKMLDYHITEGQLTLNFNTSYKEQDVIAEILTRAALVKTFIQIPEVQHVSFTVNGEPLTDASGDVVGVMNADTFIDNTGNDVNTYEKAKIQLYFASEKGDSLIEIDRNIVYSGNIPIERQMVEEIIAGPKEKDILSTVEEEIYPVVNPQTKIISVSIRDGVCYVNLDEGFLNQVYDVSPEVTIYAITNSLVELPNVNKVQISVGGETNVNYRENMNLSTVFERNLDLVK